ncbi:unnamed protein product [Musa banksii]
MMLQASSSIHRSQYHFDSLSSLPLKSLMFRQANPSHTISRPQSRRWIDFLSGSWRSSCSRFKSFCSQVLDSCNTCDIKKDKDTNVDRLDSVLPVQTLRNFPIEKLYGEVVMVRLDSALLLNLRVSDDLSLNRAILTIKYLYNAGAKVILVSNWPQANASRLLSKEAFADHLSALLKVKVVPANDASAILQFKMKNVENADVLLLDNLDK